MQAKHFVTPEKTEHHAQILANRVKNRYAHLRKKFARENIECFRLYDWDIPEVRAVVDWYAGHIVVAEYVREQTGPDWLPKMAEAVAEALNIPANHTHLKRRQTMTEDGHRYHRLNSTGHRFQVRERDLRFWINLDDFLDTGLFSDHRDTRVIIEKVAAGKDFLNLFAYTGAFTCAAAKGGAKRTVTVDRSDTYLKWARDNMELNGLMGPQHTLIQSDVDHFLEKTLHGRERFTLAIVDPPSFFRDEKKGTAFDINRDHPHLIKNVLKVMLAGSTLFFSTNHQGFEPRMDDLPVREIKELTPKTIPEDYRNKHIHRCWQITV